MAECIGLKRVPVPVPSDQRSQKAITRSEDDSQMSVPIPLRQYISPKKVNRIREEALDVSLGV